MIVLGLVLVTGVGLLLAWTPIDPRAPADDPRIPAVVAWMEDQGFFCAEDPDCLPDGARRYIAENEAEGIYTVEEMFKRTEELSDP